MERNLRKTRVGIVTSDKMDKTVVVTIKDKVRHPLYNKIVNRTVKYKAHDEDNTCGVGDKVQIMECRPMSKDKRWRVVEIIEKAKAEGREFFEGNPQDNYPDNLDKYRKLMKENKWETGQDDEELFEYAMHPAQYEAYKSGKAKEDFLEDVAKRRAEKDKSPEEDAKPKTLTVQVDGQAYRVTVAYGDAELPATPAAAAPAGEGKDVLSPLEGKFFLVKNAQETALQVGDTVKEGDVLGYVEAMKTYNAIRAEFGGTVTAICANPGDAVSEDDVLMKIR